MIDRYQRVVRYLRVSVLDRCNLACVYCMPRGGIAGIGPADQLAAQEIERLVRIFAGLGVQKIRLTGGEPTLRRGIAEIAARVKGVNGIQELAMTSNGIALAKMAASLKEAGLDRVNISLDTLQPEKFRRITGQDRLSDVLAAVEASLEAGLRPVKLNTVLMRDINDDEILPLARFAVAKQIGIRFIEVMPTHQSVLAARERLMPSREVKEILEKEFELEDAANAPGSPSRDFWIAGTKTVVGFISPLSNFFCAQCNRVRLKANGKLKTCLHGEEGLDLRAMMRAGATDTEISEAVSREVFWRPAEHYLNNDFVPHKDFFMSAVGG